MGLGESVDVGLHGRNYMRPDETEKRGLLDKSYMRFLNPVAVGVIVK
jgi:hypothetical protein